MNVCGCRRRLRFYADVRDLEPNTGVTPDVGRSTDDFDLISVSGADPNQHVRAYTGVRMRSITPFDCAGGTTFVYAPLGAVPAGLDCSPRGARRSAARLEDL